MSSPTSGEPACLRERDRVAVPELGVGRWRSGGEPPPPPRARRAARARRPPPGATQRSVARGRTGRRRPAARAPRRCAGAERPQRVRRSPSSAYSASARSGCAKRRVARTPGSSRPAAVASSSARASSRAEQPSASRSTAGSNSIPRAAAARISRRVSPVRRGGASRDQRVGLERRAALELGQSAPLPGDAPRREAGARARARRTGSPRVRAHSGSASFAPSSTRSCAATTARSSSARRLRMGRTRDDVSAASALRSRKRGSSPMSPADRKLPRIQTRADRSSGAT